MLQWRRWWLLQLPLLPLLRLYLLHLLLHLNISRSRCLRVLLLIDRRWLLLFLGLCRLICAKGRFVRCHRNGVIIDVGSRLSWLPHQARELNFRGSASIQHVQSTASVESVRRLVYRGGVVNGIVRRLRRGEWRERRGWAKRVAVVALAIRLHQMIAVAVAAARCPEHSTRPH